MVDDAGAPIPTPCNEDYDCSLPASRCGSPQELDYYTEARCVNGLCSWQRQTMGCSCYAGGCQGTTTDSASIIVPIDGVGGQAGQIDLDAPIDHAMVAAPDAGSCIPGDDASACAVPPSVCTDDGWLAYFTNGSCQDNVCQWEVAYRDCHGLGCQAGGCILNVTK